MLYQLFSIMDIIVPSKQCLDNHVAVRLEHCIVVLKSVLEIEYAEIWTYNLWTDAWMQHTVPFGQYLPETKYHCGVAIGKDIYMFGGLDLYSLLLKLTRNVDSSFTWSIINMEDPGKTPCPRTNHCGWEHGKKLWIFGGRTRSSPVGYLNNYGDFHRGLSYWITNQLICYNPSTQTWRDVQCFGNVPLPRNYASVAIIKDTVWTYGGLSGSHMHKDFHELNMDSLQWTHIDISIPESLNFVWSLTPITTSQLVVHDGCGTWIFDVLKHKWRKYHRQNSCNLTSITSTTGLNSDVIILASGQQNVYNPIFSVMLEPKNLQQLAMKTIHRHRETLPWNSLPSSLQNKMMITETN